MSDIFSIYEGFVDFFADFLGENAEVVLHDLSDINMSIRKIRNSHISGRQVGDSITDLVAKAIKNNDRDTRYRCNYLGRSKNNHQLKCATYFIRNTDGEIIGSLCINMKVDEFIEVRNTIDKFLGAHQLQPDSTCSDVEHIGLSVPEMVNCRITNIVTQFGGDVSGLSKQTRIEILTELNDEGVFLMKGAVSKVAKQLSMSEATVYKHLQKDIS